MISNIYILLYIYIKKQSSAIPPPLRTLDSIGSGRLMQLINRNWDGFNMWRTNHIEFWTQKFLLAMFKKNKRKHRGSKEMSALKNWQLMQHDKYDIKALLSKQIWKISEARIGLPQHTSDCKKTHRSQSSHDNRSTSKEIMLLIGQKCESANNYLFRNIC
jgi:hypothetical protein